MSPAELTALIHDVNADIARMTRAAETQHKIREEIRHRAQHPMEEQLIDEDSFGNLQGAPRIVRIDNVELKIWKIHRAGLQSTDIKGADLYYEIANEKFVLVQYKSPGNNGRVAKDSKQLDVLRAACPNQCAPASRFSCGSWFAVRDGGVGAYYPACEADRIFGTFVSRSASAFINGLSKTGFQKEFRQCHIGGRTTPIDVNAFREESLEADHLYFRVLNRRLPIA